ncbi:DUF1127 domain-containing protein [Salinarimonas chemoclinalis]|uniref:DUF1127 domain-containing protein n=1 Tax=Salinarimonas chemoclinalis TaxID=3241599 RepID=UPI0035587836
MSATCLSHTCSDRALGSVPLVPRRAKAEPGLFGGLIARLARELRLRRAARTLEAMPDHLLSDIGLARGDIPDAIRNGRAWREDGR